MAIKIKFILEISIDCDSKKENLDAIFQIQIIIFMKTLVNAINEFIMCIESNAKI